jgi:hypothetical protein
MAQLANKPFLKKNMKVVLLEKIGTKPIEKWRVTVPRKVDKGRAKKNISWWGSKAEKCSL